MKKRLQYLIWEFERSEPYIGLAFCFPRSVIDGMMELIEKVGKTKEEIIDKVNTPYNGFIHTTYFIEYKLTGLDEPYVSEVEVIEKNVFSLIAFCVSSMFNFLNEVEVKNIN